MHRAQRMLGRRVGVWLAAVLGLSACTGGASTSGTPERAPSSPSASASSASPSSASPSSSTPRSGSGGASEVRIEVLSANVRAGSRHQRPLDIKGGDDREAFARRVFGKGLGKPPDVIMLQETLGSSRRTLRTLNRHPRARRVGARYAIAQGPEQRRGVVRCDGRRRPSELIRDTTTLVNVRTVGPVVDTGAFRTWGRWKPRPGRPATGCAEQGWVRAGVRGSEGSELLLVNLHLAPADPRLKNRALDVARKATLRLHRANGRDAMVVLAGDLNMVRCRTLAVRPERWGCRPRPAHGRLEQVGFVDAVRERNRRGAYGVVGVRGRIDFIYTLDEVRSSAWDRCYLAFLVTVDPCGDRAVFRSEAALHECQLRADQAGRPGGLCPARQYRRYYSDHPIMRANLTR